MKSGQKITIKNPCDKNWDQMISTEGGRHCVSCDKLIIDFTLQTDQEILDFLKRANGNVCGKLSNTQLSNNSLKSQKRLGSASLWHKTAASLLFLLGINNVSANAFQAPTKNYVYIQTTERIDKKLQIREGINSSDSIEIRGKIIQSKTKEPMPFVQIISITNNIQVQTDINGNYSIILPYEKNLKEIELTIAAVSHVEQKIKVSLKSIHDKKSKEEAYPVIILKDIILEHSFIGLVEVYVLPKKKWYKFW